jgi:hypothetical protein
MTRNIDVVPTSTPPPGVRLYGDSMEPIERRQTTQVERHETVVNGGAPTSDTESLGPGDVVFRGTWLGADASTLADRLRTILNDDTVFRVNVQARDQAGNSVGSRYNGTYRLADESVVRQSATGIAEAWEYRIILIED